MDQIDLSLGKHVSRLLGPQELSMCSGLTSFLIFIECFRHGEVSAPPLVYLGPYRSERQHTNLATVGA